MNVSIHVYVYMCVYTCVCVFVRVQDYRWYCECTWSRVIILSGMCADGYARGHVHRWVWVYVWLGVVSV